MDTRALGRSGLTVQAVGMGTWSTFDVRGSRERHARDVVDTALEHGAALFDSSPMYGEAERVLGSALEGRRVCAVVATKVWAHTAVEGRAQFARSLRFFLIDLYQIHNRVNWREHLDMIEALRDGGQVAAIGATHYSAAALGELAQVMRTGGISAIQVPYNPHERDVERTILPLAADLGLGVVVVQRGSHARQRGRGQPAMVRPGGATSGRPARRSLIPPRRRFRADRTPTEHR